MNLKEYLFYFNTTATDLAHELDMSPSYVQSVISGHFPVSKKFRKNIEKATFGIVSQFDVDGPMSHPTYKKVMKDKTHPIHSKYTIHTNNK